MELPGNVAIVISAANGIGAAVACTFAREDAAVIIADLDVVAGQELPAQITVANGRTLFAQANAALTADTERLVETAGAAFYAIP